MTTIHVYDPASAGTALPELAPLPIGFAVGPKLTDVNPRTNAPMTALGLTCAACHTGRFTYQGTAVLVDGAHGPGPDDAVKVIPTSAE